MTSLYQIEIVKQVFPHDDIVVLDETPRLTFTEGIRMLKESGYKNDDGSEIKEDEDLSTPAERRLGQLVKEKFGADYYILGAHSFWITEVSQVYWEADLARMFLCSYRQIPAGRPTILHDARRGESRECPGQVCGGHRADVVSLDWVENLELLRYFRPRRRNTLRRSAYS